MPARSAGRTMCYWHSCEVRGQLVGTRALCYRRSFLQWMSISLLHTKSPNPKISSDLFLPAEGDRRARMFESICVFSSYVTCRSLRFTTVTYPSFQTLFLHIHVSLPMERDSCIPSWDLRRQGKSSERDRKHRTENLTETFLVLLIYSLRKWSGD